MDLWLLLGSCKFLAKEFDSSDEDREDFQSLAILICQLSMQCPDVPKKDSKMVQQAISGVVELCGMEAEAELAPLFMNPLRRDSKLGEGLRNSKATPKATPMGTPKATPRVESIAPTRNSSPTQKRKELMRNGSPPTRNTSPTQKRKELMKDPYAQNYQREGRVEPSNVFDEIQNQIQLVMNKEILPLFMKSPEYFDNDHEEALQCLSAALREQCYDFLLRLSQIQNSPQDGGDLSLLDTCKAMMSRNDEAIHRMLLNEQMMFLAGANIAVAQDTFMDCNSFALIPD